MTYERLRLAREQKGWTIEEVSRRSGIRPRTIELIDRGDFAELPAGLYCRSSIRSYATAVGLDGAEVIESLRSLLPSEGDPLDALARRCGHNRKAETRPAVPAERPAAAVLTAAPAIDRPVAIPAAAAVVPPVPMFQPAEAPVATAATLAVVDDIDVMVVRPMSAVEADDDLRLTAATSDDDTVEIVFAPAARLDERLSDSAGAETTWTDPEEAPRLAREPPPPAEPGREWWRPAAASAIDGAFLVGIGGGLVWLTALVGATSVPVVLRSAAPGIALVFAVIVSLYFVLFGGVGNGTPGGTLMRLEGRPSGRTVLNVREVFGRAARAVYRDGSLVVDGRLKAEG